MTTTEPHTSDVLDDEPDVLPAVVGDDGGGEVALLAELAERARHYARRSKAANTLRAYESDLRHFGAWCEARALRVLPAEAETVALYLVDHAERLAVSTLRRRLAAISEAHQAARLENARAGVAEHRIMRQGRWTTSQAMRGYIQEGELFIDNPSAKLGL